MRVLFHVNHLWGVGHFSRTAAIANAVVAAGGSATLIAGNRPVEGRLHPDVRLVELPSIRSPDTTYARLVDGDGAAVGDDLWDRRGDLIDDALAEATPDVVVTETFPFGRRKLSRELLHLIGAAKSTGAKIVASIRDLPAAPSDARRLEECADRLQAHYDAVLVHGDPAIVGLDSVWPGEIPVPCHMTGYVSESIAAFAGSRRGVIVSGGGGGDSRPLLEAALVARRNGLCAGEPWTFVAGPVAPEGFMAELKAEEDRGLEIFQAVRDLPERIGQARLSISRGGYNTVVETIAARTPCVVVPFAPEGEPEQARRAEMFAAAGLLQHVPEDGLHGDTLAAAGRRALAGPPPDPAALNLDGAAHSAALLARLVSGV